MSVPLTLAGVLLWSLALYLSFWELSDRTITQVASWLGRVSATTSLALPQALGSLVSLLPALVGGLGLFFLLANTLSFSWALTLGFMVATGAGIYQLGRSTGKTRKP
ncbi:hypothetical protein [Candidatus Cyanaurora vandensis]|uniref:hypothetical protein n=1 Tax=Candidatus Cyanaurora vandensis TaxID=2714958 RepID=UPI00257DB2AF|nr:hypothetical protein [Candidatus Cyanaurora vandensis]